MRTDAFDFDLAPERIALRPLPARVAPGLLTVHPRAQAELADHRVGELPELLRAGDALVVNDTKVIPARLKGRGTGAGAGEPPLGGRRRRRAVRRRRQGLLSRSARCDGRGQG